MLVYVSELFSETEAYWLCRLERDTYFFPSNFRKMVVDNKMDVR